MNYDEKSPYAIPGFVSTDVLYGLDSMRHLVQFDKMEDEHLIKLNRVETFAQIFWGVARWKLRKSKRRKGSIRLIRDGVTVNYSG
jgi:hypothetical protein